MGMLGADAYSGHNQVMGQTVIIEVGCWAHAIRRFKTATVAHRLDAPKILKNIGKLYKVEEKTQGMTAEQRYAIRQQKSAPMIAELFKQFQSVGKKVVPKSPLR